MAKEYKTTRKYKCPYCEYKAQRGHLVDHVNRKHESLLPEGYTADRAVFDSINGKNYGICMSCKCKVYKWNEKIGRYYNLCDKPECRSKVRSTALERHIRVYNKPTLLGDPEQQEKMLANRKISGTYTFSDGGKVTFTGKYERNALEFMDKVLGIPSTDIQAPGPVLEYEYNGETHKWITDIYYIPGNLLIEIKDGGSNPNSRSMVSYREKQIAKEIMVTNLGTFNYIRLTDNQFDQLLDIFADMKAEALEHPDDAKVKIHINESSNRATLEAALTEEVGGLPPNRPPEAYIIPYGMNNVFDGFAYGDSDISQIILSDNAGGIMPLQYKAFIQLYETGPMLKYIGKDVREKMDKIHEMIRYKQNPKAFVEMLIGRKLMKYEDVLLTECFRYIDTKREESINKLIGNGIVIGLKEAGVDLNIVRTIGHVMICQSPNGYYAKTSGQFNMASDYFSDVESLITSGIIELMNDVYNANKSKGNGDDTSGE